MSDQELFQEDQPKEIVQIQTDDLAPEDRLMALAISSGKIDMLERFIALREKEEARQSKLAFNLHFAEMQKEFPTVKRGKQGYDYKYAPIEMLQQTYGPIIAAHGFSYRWREEAIESGKRCVMIISGWGHSEENSFDIPLLTGTKQMNAVQVAGAMSSYGRRYTFIAGFGVIIEDEDQMDSLTFDEGVLYAEEALALKACNTVKDLVEKWQGVYTKLVDDPIGREKMAVVYDACKKQLQGKA